MYHPPAPGSADSDDRLIDLYELRRNAEDVLEGDATEVLPELTRAGGSPGGASPKVLVGIRGDRIISGEGDLPDRFSHWIVKFAAREDARDAGPVEFAYSTMAKAAGIDLPPTRLGHALPDAPAVRQNPLRFNPCQWVGLAARRG